MGNHNTNIDFAKRLHLLRRVNDKKQTDIADFLSITQQAYSKLERGEVAFSDEIIDKICVFFDIPVNEFINTDDRINCVNSPNSNNYNNQNSLNNTSINDQLLNLLIEEIKQTREERKFYLQTIQNLFKSK